jgi:hypothetical protein
MFSSSKSRMVRRYISVVSTRSVIDASVLLAARYLEQPNL